jgi:Mlc titration factor MtfA (ptsG expression regulator)
MRRVLEWLRFWRRPPPEITAADWRLALRQIPYCLTLPPADRERLRTLVAGFLATKTFEGAAGQPITDRLRCLIALQACLPILNLGLDWYDDFAGIVVYPGDFRVRHRYLDEHGVEHEETEDRAGESWERGPVILSWQAVAAGRDAGQNVVLHEFAHKLDMQSGVADGCPPLHRGMDARAWQADFHAAYDDLCARVDRGEDTLIDPYAGESPAEFFAVMSEVFFLEPLTLRTEYPRVYAQLRVFYRQDPAAVLGGGG